MKKYVLSFSLIIAFVFYVMLENQSSISVVANPPANNQNSGTTGGETSPSPSPASTTGSTVTVPGTASPQSTTGSPSTAPPAPAATGLYKDGSYNGDSVDAYFGNVQVQAVVSGGKLTNVNVLDYPKDRGTSARINNAAMPKLVSEAITSQSSNVDIVSGATQTSQGFQQSLASALAKAKN